MFTWDWLLFLYIILALLALSFIVLGALTAYFGSGKSRAAGVILLIVGILVPVICYFLSWKGHFIDEILLPGLLYIGGGLIGVVIGFLVFLAIIMKT